MGVSCSCATSSRNCSSLWNARLFPLNIQEIDHLAPPAHAPVLAASTSLLYCRVCERLKNLDVGHALDDEFCPGFFGIKHSQLTTIEQLADAETSFFQPPGNLVPVGSGSCQDNRLTLDEACRGEMTNGFAVKVGLLVELDYLCAHSYRDLKVALSKQRLEA